MNIRDDDQVSAVALVIESEAATAAPVLDEPVDLASVDAPDLTDEIVEPADEDAAEATDDDEPDSTEE
jgi:Mg/Co/Ni transporter MgtE